MRFYSVRLVAQNILPWPRRPRPVARENLASAGRVVREIAMAVRRALLAAGHDVTGPQFLDRPDFLPKWEDAANDAPCVIDLSAAVRERRAARQCDRASRQAEAAAGTDACCSAHAHSAPPNSAAGMPRVATSWPVR